MGLELGWGWGLELGLGEGSAKRLETRVHVPALLRA